MDQQNHVAKNYDDLFSGEPDRLSSPSPHAKGDDSHFNSEDAAWAMRDQAVAEHQTHLDVRNSPSTQLLDRPDVSHTTDRTFPENLRQGLDITNSDDIYNDMDDPVLWEDSDGTFDSYEDDGFDMIDPRNIITSSPTEPELIVKGFEFHNRLSEEIKNQFFPEDHLRQACRDIDPTLPRKVQWRAWKAAEDRYHFLRSQADIHGGGREEDRDNIFQSAARDHEIVGITQSLPPKDVDTGITHAQSANSEIPGLELSHASIVRSKPYLSDLKPAETRGQYPSLIPRSPQRALSRASSLSSSAMPDAVEDLPDGLPLTRTESMLQGNKSSANFETDKDMPLVSKSELLENEVANDFISSPLKASSEDIEIHAYGLRTPSQKPLDSAGMESTRAVKGSPVRFQFDEMSRPDTPRPSFSNKFVLDTVELDQNVNTWTDYRTSAVAPRSTSPSPSSSHSMEYWEDPDISMTLKEETDTSASVDHVPSAVQHQKLSQISGLHLSSTDLNAGLSVLARSPDKIDDLQISSTVQDESQGAERREAWLKFDEILQKAKDQVSAKSKSIRSPSTRMEFSQFQELPQASGKSLAELQEGSETGPPRAFPLEATIAQSHSLSTNTDLKVHVHVQSPDPEQPRPSLQLMEPWQEPCIWEDESIDSSVLSSVTVSSTAEMPQLQSEYISQLNSNDRMGPDADQSDQIRVYLPDSPPPEPSSELISALHQAKRGQRAATGVRPTTRGVAQPVKRSRGVSTKDKSSSKNRTVTGKTGPAIGVQGDNVKIQKPRASARATSRKATNFGKPTRSNNSVPEVPPIPEPEQMDIDDTPLDQDLVLPELKQEAVAVAVAAAGASLKVNKTRKKPSPTKSKPAPTKPSEEPKTPIRSTTSRRQNPQTSLTPQPAGGDATPRRRSPRLVAREERAKAAAAAVATAAVTEASRREQTPVVEMDIDPPQTPGNEQASADANVEPATAQSMWTTTNESTTTPKQKPAGKVVKRKN